MRGSFLLWWNPTPMHFRHTEYETFFRDWVSYTLMQSSLCLSWYKISWYNAALLNMELFFSSRYLQFLQTFNDFDYQSGKNFSLARNRGMNPDVVSSCLFHVVFEHEWGKKVCAYTKTVLLLQCKPVVGCLLSAVVCLM